MDSQQFQMLEQSICLAIMDGLKASMPSQRERIATALMTAYITLGSLTSEQAATLAPIAADLLIAELIDKAGAA